MFATDFSPSSQAALEHASDLAQRLGAELAVLHVFERPFYLEPGVSHRLQVRHDVDQWLREVREEAERQLAALAETLRSRGLRVTETFRDGVPDVEIVHAAKDLGADLIVVGTHGRTGLPHMLIGSVAERVVRHSPVPVLTVRPPQLAPDMPPKGARVRGQ